MSTRSGTAWSGRPLWLLLLALPFTGCRDQSPLAPESGGPSGQVFGSGAVRLSLVERAAPEAGYVAYTLRLSDNGARVGAYQGTFQYAPGALDVLAVRGPDGQGEFHAINSDPAGGTIRFAAYALGGFADSEVLTITARSRAGAADPRFTATLSVAADDQGRSLLEPAQADFPRLVAYSMASDWAGPAFIGLNAGTSATLRVAPGSRIALPAIVNVDSAGTMQLNAVQASIAWTTPVLTFESIEPGPKPGATFSSNTAGAGSGTVTFSAGNLAPLSGSTTLATAYFTAGANTAGTMVWLGPLAATSSGGSSLLASVRPRSVSLCVAPTGKWGDANNDAGVNIIDAQQIARFSVGLSVLDPAAVSERGDVTADGAVNIIDAQQVARFSVGLSAAARVNTYVYQVPATTAITTTSSTLPIPVGSSSQIDAHTQAGLTETTGCSRVTWASSNPAVAVVNQTGLVSGISAGTANITAQSDGIILTLQITVQ